MNASRRSGKARPTRCVALAPRRIRLGARTPALSGAEVRPRRGGRRADQTRRGGRQGAGARKRGRPRRPPVPIHSGVGRAGGAAADGSLYTVRLSATDISALASMKNVAKCGTWCELQNPANHRVFERKLRPRPSGRGHACLGVTPSDAPFPRGATTGSRVFRMRMLAPRASPTGAAGRRAGRRRGRTRRMVDALAILPSCRRTPEALGPPPPRPTPPVRAAPRPPVGAAAPRIVRPQVRRGHPPSLSISISGGEETYEDSPSNGERTGTSPA